VSIRERIGYVETEQSIGFVINGADLAELTGLDELSNVVLDTSQTYIDRPVFMVRGVVQSPTELTERNLAAFVQQIYRLGFDLGMAYARAVANDKRGGGRDG
jgi:hypothetical protein